MKIILFFIIYSTSAFALVGPTNETVVDYKYEINTAPLAFLADWYSLDLIKYDMHDATTNPPTKFGYGLSAVTFLRNSNNASDTFPSRNGYAFGATVILDNKENYYAAHAFYEKFEKFSSSGSSVQEREGFRGNIVVGGKEFFKKNYCIKFGWGLEVQAHKVREFNEQNRFVQNNYYTVQLNPFFLEFKLAGLF